MHKDTLEQWQHYHDFLPHQHEAEKNTQIVMLLTTVTMIIEIITGLLFGSMALLADGWHMATHVAAFGITLFAYHYARKNNRNPQYTFGTGKVSVLGGFASAIALVVIAFIMALESGIRFFNPHPIQFNEAIIVAIIGLSVNLISAWLLRDNHHHDHHHTHDHNHHSHRDHNIQAAYLHVLADALTSMLAIVALFGGKWFGWIWLDAVMGIVGAGVITKWSYGLIQETSGILLDGAVDKQTRLAILNIIENDHDNRISDLHIWYLNQDQIAAMVSLVTHYPQPPNYYKKLLTNIPNLVHVSIEVNPCLNKPCLPLISTQSSS